MTAPYTRLTPNLFGSKIRSIFFPRLLVTKPVAPGMLLFLGTNEPNLKEYSQEKTLRESF